MRAWRSRHRRSHQRTQGSSCYTHRPIEPFDRLQGARDAEGERGLGVANVQ